jgi:hypothetical protein
LGRIIICRWDGPVHLGQNPTAKVYIFYIDNDYRGQPTKKEFSHHHFSSIHSPWFFTPPTILYDK